MVVEVGSERCDSEGHDTDIENAHDMNPQNKADQIDTLKGKYLLFFLEKDHDLTNFFFLQSF